jgi:Ca2+-binding RTX toxin-like protein
MVGNLDMGSGADTYDGRGGELIGEINGGAGNDTFYAGAEAEQFVGGADFDQLSYVYSRVAVTVTLDDPSLNTGDAFGDTIAGIEVIVGTAAGNDFLRGDAGNNVLVGHNGNDTMFGLAGADTLRGDRGNDTLGGGMGDDAFRFLSVNDGIDTILDFSSVGVGNNDTIQISAAGFGAGLVAGALNPLFFQSRADNLAQDADDRFIFRTTDQTLWFDSNGSAAGGLTQLADLQTGATMTSLDIVLI